MATILLTDGQQRKTLSAARSLGRAGHRVLVAEVTRFATARFSRYVAKGLVCPDPAAEPDRFRDWLQATVRVEQVDCVIPMDDHTTEIVAGGSAGAASLVPGIEQFAVARDKATTVALARGAGVRVPGEFNGIFPAVVKARHSSGGRGIRLVQNASQLAQSMDGDGDLCQEYIPPGRKFDVCLLFDREGALVASFVQEELRGYPLWSGPSTLQESVHRPDLVELAVRLLAPIGWRGPVEVEFMEDLRTGEPVLMEINPRFWASLDLAVRCGVDFPRWTAELALGQRPVVQESYEAGRRCRWLLPGDLLHFLANPDRFRMDPPFFASADQRTHDDILSWEDPLPTLGFCLACTRYLFDVRKWRMVIR